MAETCEIDRIRHCATAEGRRALLAEIFERHRPRLRSMVELRLDPRVRKRLGPSDVLQESFLEAARRLDDCLDHPVGSLFLWLRFVTQDTLRTLHRRHLGTKKRDARREVPILREPVGHARSDSVAVLLVSAGPSPSQVAAGKEARAMLREALDAMEPIDREVVALRHIELLSTSEAAAVLGIPVETARKRYYRAVARLRSALGRAGLSEPGSEVGPREPRASDLGPLPEPSRQHGSRRGARSTGDPPERDASSRGLDAGARSESEGP